MLREHSYPLLGMLVVLDLLMTAAAWVLAYVIRFETGWVAYTHKPPLTPEYLGLLVVICPISLLAYYRGGLYRPKRYRSLIAEWIEIAKACTWAFVAIVAVTYFAVYFIPGVDFFSRKMFAIYFVLAPACLAISRAVARGLLRVARRRGFNLRYVAIVGTGRHAQAALHALRRNRWYGAVVQYFVDDPPPTPSVPSAPLAKAMPTAAAVASAARTHAAAVHPQPRPAPPPAETLRPVRLLRRIHGVPVYGPLERIDAIVRDHPVDLIIIALSRHHAHLLPDLMHRLRHCLADIQLVPDVTGFYAMNLSAGDLDGLPLLSLRTTSLQGMPALIKRLMDVVLAAALLVLFAVPMLVIAGLIRLTSPGPVLYRQVRMGLDGRRFTMLKFRTMYADAGEPEGPAWTRPDDARRTPLGRWLRRWSLDELPQLLNVLRGDMSLVGPRPERPELIERFKEELPAYMLRHKVRAGMTGWAQVHGLRGNTSLRKRLQYDLYYINNWSLALDIRILLLTLVRVWRHEHAY